MRHRTYDKIAAAGEPLVGDAAGRWVAQEKLHGAQLLVAVVGDEVRFGKRKAWLAPDDPFFGWQLVRADLAAQGRALARLAGTPSVVVYGELVGGGYPHPDVEPVPGLQPVQTGVWYAPDLRWAAFDVLVATGEDDEGERLAPSEVGALAAEAGVLVPPTVRAGRRTDVESTTERFPTRLPEVLGLPAIDGNLAEGIVVRPDARSRPGRAAAYKRKVEEFDEARFDGARAWDVDQRPDPDELLAWARRMTNPARIDSAASKWGRHDPEVVLDEVELDVLIDLAEAFPAVARTPTPEVEAALRAGIRDAARALL